jgi:hypothetical protein
VEKLFLDMFGRFWDLTLIKDMHIGEYDELTETQLFAKLDLMGHRSYIVCASTQDRENYKTKEECVVFKACRFNDSWTWVLRSMESNRDLGSL